MSEATEQDISNNETSQITARKWVFIFGCGFIFAGLCLAVGFGGGLAGVGLVMILMVLEDKLESEIPKRIAEALKR